MLGLESQQERLDKAADTAWMDPCGERAAHERHALCWGMSEDGAARLRFRRRQFQPSPVTRDDEDDFDGGLSTEGELFR